MVEKHSPTRTGKGPERTPCQRALARLQHRSKLRNSQQSDEVEGLQFVVYWEAAKGAFGVMVNPEDVTFPTVLRVVCRTLLTPS
jgi:mediator of RNA polymerase II transcription subunit 14